MAHASRYVVGIDLGTQSCKVVVCDDALSIRGHAIAAPYATMRPRAGTAEQDPRAWEAALAPAIGAALAAASAPADAVVAIAVVGQLDGCIAVDARGDALHPALIWEDRRATPQLLAAWPHHPLTGQLADPSHLAPKAAWLRAHGIDAARFHQPVTYLVERMTGRAVIDPALASTTMLLELATAQWSEALLEAFELRHDQLPALQPACAAAGTLDERGSALTGLPIGTIVAVGTGDDFATPLGAGLTAPHDAIVCAIGTAEVVGALCAQPVLDTGHGEPLVETHCYPSGGYFVENPGWLSGGARRWAIDLLGLVDDDELDRCAASAPPGADGVVFVPALAGAMSPVWRPGARATLHGLTAAHTRAHVARAVLEGLAFATRDVVARLRRLVPSTTRVVALGGGARSQLWMQIRADALDLPHLRSPVIDSAPLGAALIASVACGWYGDLASAARSVPAPVLAATPQRDPLLREAYARYATLVDTLVR